MSKFKSRPSPALPDLPALPNVDDVARFAAGAETRSTHPAPAPEHPAHDRPEARPDRPWERFDKDARPITGLNLRLNEYEHELLKQLAKREDRSLQWTVKKLLIAAAEDAAGETHNDNAARPR